MVISKDTVKNLLEVLERIYPKTSPSIEKLPEHNINPDELFKYIFFCWEEGFINCRTVKIEEKVEKFLDIRITSTGIRFLRDF